MNEIKKYSFTYSVPYVLQVYPSILTKHNTNRTQELISKIMGSFESPPRSALPVGGYFKLWLPDLS